MAAENAETSEGVAAVNEGDNVDDEDSDKLEKIPENTQEEEDDDIEQN